MGKKKVKSTAIRATMERIAYAQAKPGDLLCRWVMVSEWVNPEGTRFLRCTAPEHVTPWDANALLAAGIEMELDDA